MEESQKSESSDSSMSSDDETDASKTIRTRRGLSHGVFAQALKSSRLQSNSSYHWFEGNPKYGNILMLYCRTGSQLQVRADGKIFGTQDENDKFAILEILSAGLPGHVMIQGMESKRFVSMNKRGRLYGETRKDMECNIWLEEVLGSYNTYMSRSYAHLGWFLAIKRSGKPKRGNRTAWGQKAIQFLPRRYQY